MRINILYSAIITLSIFLFSIGNALASEGTIELHNIDNSDARCFAMSTIVDRTKNYQVQIQCQNLIYPVEQNAAYYILWATPQPLDDDDDDDRRPIRLGDLEFGRKSFRVDSAFSNLFVTKELTRSQREPSNERVMEGDVEEIEFLQTEPTPTPEPVITRTPTTNVTPGTTPQPQQNGGGGIISTIISVFTTIIIIIIVLAIIIFIIYKIRNRYE